MTNQAEHEGTALLVEDEPAVRAFLKAALQKLGWTVLEAGDGTEAVALSKLHEGPIRLLVTDLLLPGMNGDKLAATILGSRPKTGVLYISAYFRELAQLLGIPQPGPHFLQKPFTLSTLAIKVNEALSCPQYRAEAC